MVISNFFPKSRYFSLKGKRFNASESYLKLREYYKEINLEDKFRILDNSKDLDAEFEEDRILYKIAIFLNLIMYLVLFLLFDYYIPLGIVKYTLISLSDKLGMDQFFIVILLILVFSVLFLLVCHVLCKELRFAMRSLSRKNTRKKSAKVLLCSAKIGVVLSSKRLQYLNTILMSMELRSK
jgi:hypothetical protein